MTPEARTGASSTAIHVPPPVPYRGIEPFRYVDQTIFFAREEETERLVRYVAIYRGVLLYGDSGAGKSSLINAGFIPRILEEGFTPDRLRVQPRPGEEIVIERISLAEDGRPPYLTSSFVAGDDASPRVVLSVQEFLGKLRALPDNRRALLIFDQFEEFVTLFETAPLDTDIQSVYDAQKRILEAILELLRDHTLPVKLLFVFREDYLAKLSGLTSRAQELLPQSLRLTPLRIESLHEVIRGSFERFPGHFGAELSPSLADDLAAAIVARSEGGLLNLSEVQIVCLRLWQSPDPEAMFRQKGVQGILEDYLSHAIDQLPPELRDPAVAILSRLLTVSGTRNVIAGDDLFSIVHSEERIPVPTLKMALDALERETKLVRREILRDTAYYEIVSEFLVPWIRHQKTERTIKIEERKSQELARIRRKKMMTWMGVASLFVLLGVGFIFWMLQEKIDDQAEAIIEREKDTYQEAIEDSLVRSYKQDAAMARQEADTTRRYSVWVMQERRKDSLRAAQVSDSIRGLTTQLRKFEQQDRKLQQQNREIDSLQKFIARLQRVAKVEGTGVAAVAAQRDSVTFILKKARNYIDSKRANPRSLDLMEAETVLSDLEKILNPGATRRPNVLQYK